MSFVVALASPLVRERCWRFLAVATRLFFLRWIFFPHSPPPFGLQVFSHHMAILSYNFQFGLGCRVLGVCRESVCCGIGVCGCRRKCCGCAGTGVHLVFSEDRPASGNVAARLPPLPPPSVVWVGWRGGRVVFGGCGLLRLKCFRRTPAFFPSCVCLFGAVFVTGPCSSFACNSFFCFFALHKRPCLFLTLFRVPRS